MKASVNSYGDILNVNFRGIHNVNFTLGACEMCYESPEKKESHFSWGNKKRLPGGRHLGFPDEKLEGNFRQCEQRNRGGSTSCGWIVGCMGGAQGAT